MLFRRSKSLPVDAHKGINAWIIYVALPALSLKYLPHIQWSSHLLLAALAPVIVWLGGWLYCSAYLAGSTTDNATRGAIKITASLSNTGFVGFPLVMAYFDEQHLGIAVICDQMSFTLLSTAGVIVAINSSKKQPLSPSVVLKKLFRFPPFLGCLAALTIPGFIDISGADPLFDKLAATVGPLALFSMGLQLRFKGWQRNIKHISTVLCYKLILAPILILLVALLFQMKGTVAQTSVFEAAMPTVLTAGVIAEEYNLNPDLSNQIIGIGILLSFGTTALWHAVVQYFL